MRSKTAEGTISTRLAISAFEIRHKPVGGKDEAVSAGWLPAGGEVVIGLTSGASTPDNLVGMVVRRLDDLANLSR